MSHQRIDQPVARDNDICLGRDRLREAQELACGLGEALRRDEDGFLQVCGQRRKR